jgi:hypothetical protein
VILGRPFQKILVINPAQSLELAGHLECHNNEVAYLSITCNKTYSQRMIGQHCQIKTYSLSLLCRMSTLSHTELVVSDRP